MKREEHAAVADALGADAAGLSPQNEGNHASQVRCESGIERRPHGEAGAPMTSPSDSKIRRFGAKLVLSLVVGGLFAWMVQRGGVPLLPPKAALGRVLWWTVPTYALTVVVTTFFRAVRWRHLIAPVKRLPLKEVLVLNWVGFLAIFALPFRLGELVRPSLTRARHGIPVSVGLGTIVLERVVDGLITSLFVAIAIFALPHQAVDDPLARHIPAMGSIALLVFGAAFSVLALFVWQRHRAQRWTHALLCLVSPRLAGGVMRRVGHVADGVRSLSEPRLLLPFVAETMLYWLSNISGAWLLAWGCGLPIHLGHAAALTGVLALGILLPSGPGLFGNFQLALSSALKLYLGVELVQSAGAVWIFLLYGVQALVFIVCGLIPLYAAGIRLRDLALMSGGKER